MGQPLNPDGTGKLARHRVEQSLPHHRGVPRAVTFDSLAQQFSGMIDCFVKSARSEGFMSLYNGFWPNFGRVVPRVVIVFVVMEKLKSMFG